MTNPGPQATAPGQTNASDSRALSALTIATALLFNVGLYFLYENHVWDLGLNVPVLGEPGAVKTLDGWTTAKQFFTGYIVKKSLSMDNVFVIAIIFSSLAIPAQYQHRVLFWGIIGALVMRGLITFVGSELIARSSWIVYVFGGFLILTEIKMAVVKGHSDPPAGPVMRLARRIYPTSPLKVPTVVSVRVVLRILGAAVGISLARPAKPASAAAAAG